MLQQTNKKVDYVTLHYCNFLTIGDLYGSNLCFGGELVGCLNVSQLQGQFKPMLRVSGHSQGLLLEALDDSKKSHQQKLSQTLSPQYDRGNGEAIEETA